MSLIYDDFLVEMNIWRPSAHPNTSIRQSEVVQFHFKVRESQRLAGAGRVTRGRRSLTFGRDVTTICLGRTKKYGESGTTIGRFYKLACDGFLSIVPDVFVLHEGA